MRSSAMAFTACATAPDALYEALRDGEIDSAGLDVTEPEPLPADHRLLTLDNCLVVPHIASASYETRAAMSQLAAENIVAVLGGKKPGELADSELNTVVYPAPRRD